MSGVSFSQWLAAYESSVVWLSAQISKSPGLGGAAKESVDSLAVRLGRSVVDNRFGSISELAHASNVPFPPWPKPPERDLKPFYSTLQKVARGEPAGSPRATFWSVE